MIEINWNPSRYDLRFFAGGLTILACIFVALGASVWDWSNLAVALVVAAAAVMIILALFRPHWIRPLYLAWMVAVFPIGWIVSHVVLALVYFGVFLPIGALLRITGYDPMVRRSKRPGESYWQKRSPVTSRERYFRQY